MTLIFEKEKSIKKNVFEFEFYAEFGDYDRTTTEFHTVADTSQNREIIEEAIKYYDSTGDDIPDIEPLKDILYKFKEPVFVPSDEDYHSPSIWSMDVYYYDENGNKLTVKVA